jgi:hypothetical protein
MRLEEDTAMRSLVVAIILVALPMTAHAARIGSFPGLDAAIQRADVIAIVRIDEHVQPMPDPNLITRHRCYVYQTLKGDLTAGGIVPLNLRHTRTSFVSPFPLGSTHLVFLVRSDDGYQNLAFEGSILRLSPFGHERLPDGETLRSKISSLVNQSISYWDREWSSERAFLQEATR